MLNLHLRVLSPSQSIIPSKDIQKERERYKGEMRGEEAGHRFCPLKHKFIRRKIFQDFSLHVQIAPTASSFIFSSPVSHVSFSI